MSDFRRRTLQRTHLLIRKEHVLCTKCFTTEPVNPGNGTPLDAFLVALDTVAERHQTCKPKKAAKPAVTSKRCTAEIHHGPGHQSRSQCEVVGPHKQHSAREFYWSRKSYGKQKDKRGRLMCFSGYFDESPEEPS